MNIGGKGGFRKKAMSTDQLLTALHRIALIVIALRGLRNKPRVTIEDRTLLLLTLYFQYPIHSTGDDELHLAWAH